MDDLAVVAGSQRRLQLMRASTEEGWELRCVVVDQPAGDRVSIFVDQLDRIAGDEITVNAHNSCRKQ